MLANQSEFGAAVDREAARLGLSRLDCGGVLLVLENGRPVSAGIGLRGEMLDGEADELLSLMTFAHSLDDLIATFPARLVG